MSKYFSKKIFDMLDKPFDGCYNTLYTKPKVAKTKKKDDAMRKKQFKTDSKKLLDMMINSIYTHKEIFLRELISNASDALDKLYFRSLTDPTVTATRSELEISIEADKSARALKISDNGCGMSMDELENNLGTIAKSGSFDFKRDNEQGEDVDVIGQFGVGFYSAFMVADKITVRTKAWGDSTASLWESEGADGYTVTECDKPDFGTEITLYLKEDTDDEKYSEFLDEYRIRSLVKKYSDYIRYPIKAEITKSRKKENSEEYESYTERETLNSMVPLWKRPQSEVSDEEYKSFYTEKFFDFTAPAKVITQKSEGTATFTALLFIPEHAPYDYYTGKFEKGLELYSSGVMIMEKCADLLPDHFSFVRGLVDSQDLSLNISREMLQHDRQLKIIAKAIEKKIKSELEKMLRDERDKYEKLFDAFGIQLKYGIYSDYGMHKDTLADLLLFKTSKEKKYSTLKEYTERMAEGQKTIYYASGETPEKIEMLPQVASMLSRGTEVLYLTDDVDEFALKMLGKYADCEFKNATSESVALNDDEKAKANEANRAAEDMLTAMKDAIGSVSAVKFTASLANHPVCLSSEGELSVEMEKVLRKMPGADGEIPKASVILEINMNHPIKEKLFNLFANDRSALEKYAKILYSEACLISGISIENPSELCELISELMLK